MFSSLAKRGIYNILSKHSRIRHVATSCTHNSDDLNVHRDSHINNAKLAFQFSSENITRLVALLRNYPEGYERAALGPVLDLAQRQHGWVPISIMHEVAATLNIPRMRVYEYATFHSMYKRKYRGKYHVKVCTNLSCTLRGADDILEAVESATCCKAGELSSGEMFGVDIVECQGACVNAPLIVIDDDYYEDLTPKAVCSIIETIKYGGVPMAGPQSGRYSAEPICGETTLRCSPPGPGFMLQPALGGQPQGCQ